MSRFDIKDINRRKLLQYGFMGLGAFFGNILLPMPVRAATSSLLSLGDLGPADANGIRLPPGFTSRVVAHSGQKLFDYVWHAAPDGGAVFRVANGDWIYVSNSEIDDGGGGVGALRFNPMGEIIDAYSILNQTHRNCSGGKTPWRTWLSCEEVDRGQVWECYPGGRKSAQPRSALGLFRHEAVAVDFVRKQIYLTEDERDGCLYRYTAASIDAEGKPDLDNGVLEVAEVVDKSTGIVHWNAVPDPLATSKPTRKQIPNCTQFNGGEGIWYRHGIVYFSTKGDDRIWAYDVLKQSLSIIYDAALYAVPVLTGVDSITSNAAGELLIAEDGGNMQLVALAGGKVKPILQVVDQAESEITGPAFSPDGSRLYFSSLRGKTGLLEDGVTYEITGPF
ncbi:alkaline phosphatase PhoX [Nitrosomonas supralitoralis]|uniref:Translocation protein TolB n=1 Tax=Nitrosomonas supralitoralis TaxID=2116706 RepID=A0A2P7NTN2_9PROT|nr:alkaline phosphatase PhoX [Nitrosomonas supralitoralis]PSJ16833.1 translocation protein TolB [Nitrosomonas supralitoralis]